MSEYLLTISMDGGEAVPCLPVGENALGLNCEGITWLDKAVVSIRCDAHNELSVRAECDTSVILERSGRCLSLKAREIRLLPQDVIQFDGHRFEIESVRRYVQPKRRFSSRQAMLSAAAAAFALVAIPACQPKLAGEPEQPPQVEERLEGAVVREESITVIPDKERTLTEGGSGVKLTVTSYTIPTDPLHIKISADKPEQVIISPDTIDGYVHETNTRKVEVRCVDDGEKEEQTEVKVRFEVSSKDPIFNNTEAEEYVFCVDKPNVAEDNVGVVPGEPIKREMVEPRLTGDVVRIPPEDEKPE